MKSSNLLIFPLSLIISVLFFSYLAKPEWDKYSNNKLELEKETERLGNIKSNKSKLDQIAIDYDSLNFDQKKIIEEAITDNVSEEKFLDYLVSVVSETNIEIKSINFTKEDFKRNEIEPNILKNRIEIKVSGNFFQIKKAIYLLESLNRLVKIQNISVNPQTGSDILQIDLALMVFNKNKNKVVKVDSNDIYFSKLLSGGLNLELVNDYIKYRNNLGYPEIDLNGEVGKENLFDNNQISEEIVSSEEQGEQQENSDSEGVIESSIEEDLDSNSSNLQ
jgi:Tfp pilus assembly protein PilO